MAFILFIIWVILGAGGCFGWWLALTPVVLFALWRARAFEPRTQAWLDDVVEKIKNQWV